MIKQLELVEKLLSKPISELSIMIEQAKFLNLSDKQIEIIKLVIKHKLEND